MKRSIFGFALSVVLAVSAVLAFSPSAWAWPADAPLAVSAVDQDDVAWPSVFQASPTEVRSAVPAVDALRRYEATATASAGAARAAAFAARLDARWSRDRWRPPVTAV